MVLACSAMAQWGGNPTVPQDSIRFWTGTGNNRAVIAVTWEDDSEDLIGIAWGVQWNGGTIMLKSLIDTIATYDSRFTATFTSGGSWLSNLAYVDTELGLDLLGMVDWWWYNWKDSNDVSYSSVGITGDMIHDGDFVDMMQMGAADIMLYATNPNASETPVDATIAASDIVYWVGEGTNEVVFVVNWADTALAWGYRFAADSVTLQTMMDDIAAADARFSYSGTGLISDINYTENGTTYGITAGNWWGHFINGYQSAGLGQWFHNGDFSRWADPAAGVLVDSVYYPGWDWTDYIYVYPMAIQPVSVPVPVDATIAASDIVYWVGEGTNEVVFVVNWADTALAWGYRFAADSVTLQTMMDDIAAADARFSYSGTGMVSDINYTENGTTYGITAGNWWSHFINGYQSAGLSQWFHNGDFSRWADPAAGVLVDSIYYPGWDWTDYIYVYPMAIQPVSAPYVPGPFCGAVGTEGCDAIAANSSAIVAWATACTVERGPQDIAVEGSPLASFGSEANAVGAASTSTTVAVSLGDGGTATLTFEKPIKNGNGPDFAVFENAIRNATTGGYFLELAFVEVSSDGERFVRFPATSLTQTATQVDSYGEIDPTYINNLAGKYEVGYGTPFDLDELVDSTGLDINNVTHVRIVDVVGSIDPQYATYDAQGNIVNDPYPTAFVSGGFDLTGVAVLHQNTSAVTEVEDAEVTLWPNPASEMLTVSGAAGAQAVLYDMTGREAGRWQLTSDCQQLNLSHAAAGVYMLRINGESYKIVKQ